MILRLEINLFLFDLVFKFIQYLLFLDWKHEQLVGIPAAQLIDVHCWVIFEDFWLKVRLAVTDHYENIFFNFLQKLTQDDAEALSICEHKTLALI